MLFGMKQRSVSVRFTYRHIRPSAPRTCIQGEFLTSFCVERASKPTVPSDATGSRVTLRLLRLREIKLDTTIQYHTYVHI